jgi:NAD(P)-dependent dehydrogenase (short-subunit alcohol dehydrogenase family)
MSAAKKRNVWKRHLSGRTDTHGGLAKPKRKVDDMLLNLLWALAAALVAIAATVLHIPRSLQLHDAKHSRNPYYSWNEENFTKSLVLDFPEDERINVIVTGANSGLGLATVQHLARLVPNVYIIMACRNLIKCEQSRSNVLSNLSPDRNDHELPAVACLELDLASFSSTVSFANSVQEHLTIPTEGATQSRAPVRPRLHYLINNAGVFGSSPTLTYLPFDETRRDGTTTIEEQMRVNYLGHFYLTHLLWEPLQNAASKSRRRGARIVNVSSLAAILPIFDPTYGWIRENAFQFERVLQRLPSWVATLYHTVAVPAYYMRSKRANLMFTAELHRRFHCDASSGSAGISIITSHPGYSRTDIFENGLSFFPDLLRTFLGRSTAISMSSYEGAWTQVRAALDVIPSGGAVGPHFWTWGQPVPIHTARATGCSSSCCNTVHH